MVARTISFVEHILLCLAQCLSVNPHILIVIQIAMSVTIKKLIMFVSHFLINFIYQSHFRFTGKLNIMCRDFLYTSCPHTCIVYPIINTIYQFCMLAKIETTFVHHYHPESIVYIRSPSMLYTVRVQTDVVFVQSQSHVRLFATPWTAACQASLSFTISLSLLKLMSIESVMPSNHLILCRTLLPFIFPSIKVSSNESALCIRWPKYWSFSFSSSPSSEY